MAHDFDNETFIQRQRRIWETAARLEKELDAEYELTEADIEFVSPHSFEDTQPAPRHFVDATPTARRLRRAG